MSANESAGGAGAGGAGAGAAGSVPPASAGAASAQIPKRKNLKTAERTAALHGLLSRSTNGVLRRGAAGEVAEMFGQSQRAMSDLWKNYRTQKDAGVAVPDVSCRRRRVAKDLTQHRAAMETTPLKLRTTQRRVAAAIGLPKTTFRRRMKELGVKSHSRFLKPALTNV